MSSAKTERLVNLTMALLGTERYMTKAEIFRRVAGYSGEQDAKERMFERDKDDLRELGIDIELGGHDPFFEDEPGYRIRSESYRIPPDSFSSEELGIIAAALANWEGSTFEASSHSLLRRINSFAQEPKLEGIAAIPKIDIDESRLLEITEALAKRTTIEFSYQKTNLLSSDSRRVNPLGICAWRSSWYLVGEDLDRGEVRTFKLARIVDELKFVSKAGAYEIPEDFSISDYVMMFHSEKYRVRARLRSGSGLVLRTMAQSITSLDEDWDEAILEFSLRSEALREILWLGDEVVVIEPEDLRAEVVEVLGKIGAQNG